VKRYCPRRHPIGSDNDPCVLCRQEDEAQAASDQKLLEAILRLDAAGKLSGVFTTKKEKK
jgi:hypothetical protein